MGIGSSVAGFIRDVIVGLFAIACLIVIALVMNDGKFLEEVSPEEKVVATTDEAAEQRIVFDSTTTLTDMMSTQKVLESLGIQLNFDAMKFNNEGTLQSLTLRIENSEGKKEVLVSDDVKNNAISFDAKLFIPEN